MFSNISRFSLCLPCTQVRTHTHTQRHVAALWVLCYSASLSWIAHLYRSSYNRAKDSILPSATSVQCRFLQQWICLDDLTLDRGSSDFPCSWWEQKVWQLSADCPVTTCCPRACTSPENLLEQRYGQVPDKLGPTGWVVSPETTAPQGKRQVQDLQAILFPLLNCPSGIALACHHLRQGDVVRSQPAAKWQHAKQMYFLQPMLAKQLQFTVCCCLHTLWRALAGLSVASGSFTSGQVKG